MKKLLLAALFIASFSSVKAQTDNCKDLTQSIERNRTTYYASNPNDTYNLGLDSFVKIVEIGQSVTYFKFGITIPKLDNDIPTSDASLIFADGEIINRSGLVVNTATNALGNFYYYTFFPVTDADMIKLKSKPLSSYKLVYTKRLALASKDIMARANCISNVGTLSSDIVPRSLHKNKV